MAGCAANTPQVDTPTDTSSAARQLDPEAFAAEVESGERFVINVHTPDEGGIEGTDADIPFDQLEERVAELPQDRTAAIAVYCMSGGMSEIAVDTLAGMGYVDLVELRGGMIAWEADGRPLIAPAASQGSDESGQDS
tara:strand:- start:10266 stop:10676 length:411 start_codon:yes stop_codon:yes gene_type:complete